MRLLAVLLCRHTRSDLFRGKVNDPKYLLAKEILLAVDVGHLQIYFPEGWSLAAMEYILWEEKENAG